MSSTTKTRYDKRQRHLLKVFSLVFCLVEYYDWICEHRHLLHEAFLCPDRSPWHQMMDCGDLLPFLLITGLTCAAFIALRNILQPLGHHSLGQKGREWSLLSSFTYAAWWIISICAWFWHNTIRLFMYHFHASTKIKNFCHQKKCNNLP